MTRVLRLTTTLGRQRLPDLIQAVFGGEVEAVVFERYGRPLAMLVPLKAGREPGLGWKLSPEAAREIDEIEDFARSSLARLRDLG